MNLLVSDFDGTFYTTERNIKINVKRIKDFIDQGNIFMLSSGRSYTSLKCMIDKYHIPCSYMATEDGSHLFDSKGNLLKEDLMDKSIQDEIEPIIRLKRHRGIQYGTTRDYLENNKDNLDLSSINFIIEDDRINKDFNNEWYKLRDKYKTKYEFLIYGYNGIYFYCIKEKGIDKSRPIYNLSNILDLDKRNIFTIGDGDNDLPMIVDYNGFMIGDNDSLKRCALGCYNNVYELVDDIERQKVKRR